MNLMNFDSARVCRAGAADSGAKRYQDTAFLEQPKERVSQLRDVNIPAIMTYRYGTYSG